VTRALLPAYAVRVGGRTVTGFRYPSGAVGEGDNRVALGERRIATRCLAVLGDGDPYVWVGDKTAPGFVAKTIGPTAKVIAWEGGRHGAR